MDRRDGVAVGRRRRRRLYLREQERGIGLAGLGQVDLVARPAGLALGGEARLRVVRRGDPHRARRQLAVGTPARRAVIVQGVVVLDPDLPQRLDRREIPQPGRGRRRVHRPQQLAPIHPDLRGQGLAGRRLLRQAILVQPPAVAVGPRGRALSAQPIRHHGGERVQGVA